MALAILVQGHKRMSTQAHSASQSSLGDGQKTEARQAACPAAAIAHCACPHIVIKRQQQQQQHRRQHVRQLQKTMSAPHTRTT